MGRRDAGGRINDTAGGAWEAARRALGRLFTHATVLALGADQMSPSVGVPPMGAETLALPEPQAGAREGFWEPSAVVSVTVVPRCETGAREGNLLPAVRLAAGDYALAPPECGLLPPLRADACRVEQAAVACPVEVVGLPPDFLRLPPSPVLVQSRRLLSAPNIMALSSPRLTPPKSAAVRVPRLSPTVRAASEATLSRIALTRRCREAPPGVSAAEAFDPERRRLAETAGLPAEAVTLLGVYPGVPILAVRRLVVEDEGQRLRLWLKPEVLRGKRALRLITLLVGRRTADGKMLQAAL